MDGRRAGKWIGQLTLLGLLTGSIAGAQPPSPDQDAHAQPARSAAGGGDQLGSGDPFTAFDCRQAGDQADNAEADVFASSFNGVRPGSTTLDEAQQRWGNPLSQAVNGDTVVMNYQLPQFPQVAVIGSAHHVDSVIVNLPTPMPVASVAEALAIGKFTSVDVVDSSGAPIGCVFPERAVLLSFAEPAEQRRVAQVILEPVSGGPFRLRAEQVETHDYKRVLHDLDEATSLDDHDARAYWLRAEVLLLAGQIDQASQNVQRAVQLDPNQGLYQLTQARVLSEQGDQQAARQLFEQLAQATAANDAVAALARFHLGQLKSQGENADFHAALENHLKAIDAAADLIDAPQAAMRRLAKYTLVRAHLAVAVDIAMGNFERQEEVVPRWLAQATELAEQYMSSDGGDPTLRMHIYCTTLEAMAAIDSPMDPAVPAEDAWTEAQKLLGDKPDPLYQRQIASLLAETLYHVARLQRVHHELGACRRYAQQALALLESQHAGQDTAQVDYLRGQLAFLVGSVYAVDDHNHRAAVEWFDKARAHLEQHEQVSASLDAVPFGEMLVSMGVSYWETGAHQQALQLTDDGIQSLERQVKLGQLDADVLEIPRENLAAMQAAEPLAEGPTAQVANRPSAPSPR